MKKSLLGKLSFGLALLTLGATVSSTVAWFLPTFMISTSDNRLDSTTIGAYYASGDGSSTTPFVITKPRHLYNLAWLQYLGTYNKSTENGKQYYFVLDNDIDMSGWILPPIGTEDNPFIGNFNGQSHVVSGLTVSNNFSDLEKHPSVVNSTNFDQPHIIGFFGVVGDYNSDYQGSGSVYSSATNKFINTGLSGITINAVTQDSLVGLAAGYIDATMSNVAVDTGTVDIKHASSTAFSDSNHTFTNISDYTLVGYTTKKTSIKKVTDTIYDIDVQTGMEFNANAQGAEQGWGGSIDMKSMFQRLDNIRQRATGTTTQYRYRTITTHQANGTSSSTNSDYTNGKLYAGTGDNATVGNFNYLNPNANYMYMAGGKINVDRYYSYYKKVTAKISDGNGHFLRAVPSTANDNTQNAGSVSNDTQANGTSWSMTEGNEVYIYVNMKYQNNSTARDYYLSVYNNTTVRLTTSQTYRTAFTKETITVNNEEKIRYTYNNRYLAYDNGSWTMVDLPTAPTEPTPPSISEPVAPTEPDYDAYLSNSYQIAYVTGSTSHYFSVDGTDTSSQTYLSPSETYGWRFEVNGSDTAIGSIGNNAQVRIYTYVGTQKYYIKDGSSSPYRYYLVTGTNNAATFTRQTSGSNYIFKNTSGNYYMCCDSSNSYKFEDRSTGSGRYNTLTVKLTATILQDDYNTKLTQYQTDLAAYNTAQTNYENAVAAYPGQLAAYQALVQATYKIALVDKTITDDTTSYLDDSRETTSYEYNASNTTYFPLNVKKDGGSSSNSITNGDYRPTDANTGYVIAGSTLTSSNTISDGGPSLIRVSSYANSNISNSYSSNTITDSKVRTINASGDIPITQAYSNLEEDLEKYSSSKTSLLNVLSGNSNIYGLHFMNSQISSEHILKATNVSILGESYGNPNDSNVNKRTYDMPVNSIDFNLKEKGYINFFAGTYFSSDVTSFFSLHQIFRDTEANGYAITEIKEISAIYGNNSRKNWSYAYQYTDGTFSKPYRFTGVDDKFELSNAAVDPNTRYTEAHNLSSQEFATYQNTFSYTKLFDASWITNYHAGNRIYSLNQKYLYYFEIPMNDGEFCLGSVYGGTGGYLLYLDIGASAAKTQRTMFAEHFLEETVTFSYPTGVALIPTDSIEGTTPSFNAKNSVCVVIEPTYKGTLTLTRDNSNHVTIARAASYTNVVKPNYISDTIVSVVDPGADSSSTSDDADLSSSFEYESKIEKETYRVQYFDHNVNYDTLTRTIIEDTRTKNNDGNWGSFTRVITQQVNDGDILTLTSATQITNATIIIFKYLGKNNANNGLPWSYDDINNTSSTIYFNGTSAVTSSTICSSLDDEIIILYHTIEGEITEVKTIQLEVVQDTSIAEGTYYKYGEYIFIPVVTGGSVTFIVKQIGSQKVYFVDGNVVWDETAGKFVYTIPTDLTELTTVDQEVTAQP